jgi:hypothetical protein
VVQQRAGTETCHYIIKYIIQDNKKQKKFQERVGDPLLKGELRN